MLVQEPEHDFNLVDEVDLKLFSVHGKDLTENRGDIVERSLVGQLLVVNSKLFGNIERHSSPFMWSCMRGENEAMQAWNDAGDSAPSVRVDWWVFVPLGITQPNAVELLLGRDGEDETAEDGHGQDQRQESQCSAEKKNIFSTKLKGLGRIRQSLRQTTWQRILGCINCCLCCVGLGQCQRAGHLIGTATCCWNYSTCWRFAAGRVLARGP